jgi:hypothetical protein
LLAGKNLVRIVGVGIIAPTHMHKLNKEKKLSLSK